MVIFHGYVSHNQMVIFPWVPMPWNWLNGCWMDIFKDQIDAGTEKILAPGSHGWFTCLVHGFCCPIFSELLGYSMRLAMYGGFSPALHKHWGVPHETVRRTKQHQRTQRYHRFGYWWLPTRTNIFSRSIGTRFLSNFCWFNPHFGWSNPGFCWLNHNFSSLNHVKSWFLMLNS